MEPPPPSGAPIVVAGAAGKTGLAIIRALARRGETVRAYVFREHHADAVVAAGAKRVAFGNLRDLTAYRHALDEAQALYHLAPNVDPDEEDIGYTAITAALDMGVKRFVYHSVMHPQVEAMPHHWAKLRVEEMLVTSTLDYTILQPAAYMQNALAQIRDIVEEGVYRVPYPVETAMSIVDLEDVAEVAARVLIEPGHERASYELAGPEVLTQTRMAEIMSEVLEIKVRAEEISRHDWTMGPGKRVSEAGREMLLMMFRHYAMHGFRGNPGVLGWLLGREPNTFADVLRRLTEL